MSHKGPLKDDRNKRNFSPSVEWLEQIIAPAASIPGLNVSIAPTADVDLSPAAVDALGAGTAGVHTNTDGSKAPYVIYNGSVAVGGSLAWRNNNPGNIIAGSYATSEGAIGSNGRFAIFPDYSTGFSAMTNLLGTSSYQSLTVQGAVFKWAPPSENNSQAYANFISSSTGLSLDTMLSTLTPAQLTAVADAIQHFEGYQAGTTYTANTPNTPLWVQALLGKPVSGGTTGVGTTTPGTTGATTGFFGLIGGTTSAGGYAGGTLGYTAYGGSGASGTSYGAVTSGGYTIGTFSTGNIGSTSYGGIPTTSGFYSGSFPASSSSGGSSSSSFTGGGGFTSYGGIPTSGGGSSSGIFSGSSSGVLSSSSSGYGYGTSSGGIWGSSSGFSSGTTGAVGGGSSSFSGGGSSSFSGGGSSSFSGGGSSSFSGGSSGGSSFVLASAYQASLPSRSAPLQTAAAPASSATALPAESMLSSSTQNQSLSTPVTASSVTVSPSLISADGATTDASAEAGATTGAASETTSSLVTVPTTSLSTVETVDLASTEASPSASALGSSAPATSVLLTANEASSSATNPAEQAMSLDTMQSQVDPSAPAQAIPADNAADPPGGQAAGFAGGDSEATEVDNAVDPPTNLVATVDSATPNDDMTIVSTGDEGGAQEASASTSTHDSTGDVSLSIDSAHESRPDDPPRLAPLDSTAQWDTSLSQISSETDSSTDASDQATSGDAAVDADLVDIVLAEYGAEVPPDAIADFST